MTFGNQKRMESISFILKESKKKHGVHNNKKLSHRHHSSTKKCRHRDPDPLKQAASFSAHTTETSTSSFKHDDMNDTITLNVKEVVIVEKSWIKARTLPGFAGSFAEAVLLELLRSDPLAREKLHLPTLQCTKEIHKFECFLIDLMDALVEEVLSPDVEVSDLVVYAKQLHQAKLEAQPFSRAVIAAMGSTVPHFCVEQRVAWQDVMGSICNAMATL